MVTILLRLGVTAARLAGAGAVLAFGWIFGEHGAAKLVERLESAGKSEESKNPDTKS